MNRPVDVRRRKKDRCFLLYTVCSGVKAMGLTSIKFSDICFIKPWCNGLLVSPQIQRSESMLLTVPLIVAEFYPTYQLSSSDS
jgi:hypothetical protein